MIFVDNIEQFTDPEREIANQWHGTLQSVDISYLVIKGIAPVVYLSADTVQINQQTGVDLEDASVWTRLEDFGDISRAKTVAIDMRKDANGNDYVLGANNSVLAYLYMTSPATEPDAELPEGQAPLAHNAVCMSSRLISTFNDDYYEDRVNFWDYDTAELRIMGDLPILKLDASDHTTPVEGISFRLTGTSAYGTNVDNILETDNQGSLVFKDIERGTYTLKEYQGSPDYLKIDGVMTVEIHRDGTVTVNGDTIDDAFVIDDPPRIHTDITFNKKDLRNKYKVVPGVRFHLEGTSDYGNRISEDAVSDENGIVTFANIEMGTYTMRETSTINGYILNETVFDVRVDENTNFAINGSFMEKDGTLTIYNEPLHSFTIQKEGTYEVDGIALPVGGAVFNLSGTSDYGTEVNVTKTTESNGRVTFGDLEAGTYIIYEVSAPEGYTLDPTRRVVTITELGNVTIDGVQTNSTGYFVIKNDHNSTVVITKKWEDKFTNDTREAEPVIHLGIENDTPAAFFYSFKDSSILGDLFGDSNITAFAPGDEETAQSKIADGSAVRIDDSTTSKSIYAWIDNGTVYWWSDASMVYMTDEAHHLWYGLTACTSINVSGIDISFLTDMSHMFYNCKALKTLTGVDSWDVSKVTDMSYMFYHCSQLTDLSPISDWNVSKVTNMYRMFLGCSSLNDLSPLSGWDFSNVTNMGYMFQLCHQLTTADLSGWYTGKVTNMSYMFYGCEKLKTIYVSSLWNTSKVTNSNSMFYGTNLVGGNGTHYNSSYIDKTYARIDTDSTPGYLTYKKRNAPTRFVEEVYNNTSPNCEMKKLNDTTWTYTFTGLNPSIQYYAWEDEIEGYTSANMGETNFLTVKNGIGTITNTADDPPKYGDLTVKKNVQNKDGTENLSDADKLRTFLFTVQLTDADGAALTETLMLDYVKTADRTTTEGTMAFRAGKASFRLADDNMMKFTGIPEGYKYTVAETPEEGFDAVIAPRTDSGTISSEQPQTVLYTNRKNYEETEDDVTFTLSKTVTGNFIDPAEQFGFTVYFENLRANGIYTVTSNKSQNKTFTANASGISFVELTLVDGETVSFTVPENTGYTITELAGAYTSSYEITDSENLGFITQSADYSTKENQALSTKPETADSGEKISVVFTNVKDIRQKLTLLKQLQDVPAGTTDQFEFTIDIYDLEAGCILNTSLGRLIAADDGTVSSSFYLTSGTPFVIQDIPVGAIYEITERASAYMASCEIKSDDNAVIYTNANSKPELSLSTRKHPVQANQDHQVVFTNKKVACDITITKVVDMSYSILPEREYSAHEFKYDIVLKGLGELKYNEIIVEYNKKNTAGSVRKTLADVMNMTAAEGQQQTAESVSFTITLHHNESFRIRNLPYNASCMVTEQASEDYIASYTINANANAVLQTAPRANDHKNTALALSTEEIIDPADKDIEFVFRNQYEFSPYSLPAAGTDDIRPMLAITFCGLLFFAAVFFTVSKKRKNCAE